MLHCQTHNCIGHLQTKETSSDTCESSPQSDVIKTLISLCTSRKTQSDHVPPTKRNLLAYLVFLGRNKYCCCGHVFNWTGSSGPCEWTRFAELYDAGGFFQDENYQIWLNQKGENREKPAVVQTVILRQSKR